MLIATFVSLPPHLHLVSIASSHRSVLSSNSTYSSPPIIRDRMIRRAVPSQRPYPLPSPTAAHRTPIKGIFGKSAIRVLNPCPFTPVSTADGVIAPSGKKKKRCAVLRPCEGNYKGSARHLRSAAPFVHTPQ